VLGHKPFNINYERFFVVIKGQRKEHNKPYVTGVTTQGTVKKARRNIKKLMFRCLLSLLKNIIHRYALPPRLLKFEQTVGLLGLFCFSAVPANQSAPPIILIVGDSLSSAYGLNPQQGWVHLLAERLENKGYRYQVVNASISGDTTRSGLARLPQALQTYRPSIVIIELGANDGLRGIDPKQMQDNLLKMIALGRRQDAHVVLVGVRLPSNYGKVFIERFTAVYPRVAETTEVPLVPLLLKGVAENLDLFQTDGIHPGAQAQVIMLDNVWSVLNPLLIKP
jgi:acyl-CoA thioesterase-1